MAGPDPQADEQPVAVLRRWEGSGAVWRVLGRTGTSLRIGLYSCDGGEEMGRVVSADHDLRAFVDGRSSSAD